MQYNIIITFVLRVLFQRGDDGAPRALSYLQRSKAVLRPEIKATARCKKQLRDGSMPSMGRDVEGSGPTLLLKINVTASFNQLHRDGHMPFERCGVHRRASVLCLNINVTVSFRRSHAAVT